MLVVTTVTNTCLSPVEITSVVRYMDVCYNCTCWRVKRAEVNEDKIRKTAYVIYTKFE
jgi:hypothetical protein